MCSCFRSSRYPQAFCLDALYWRRALKNEVRKYATNRDTGGRRILHRPDDGLSPVSTPATFVANLMALDCDPIYISMFPSRLSHYANVPQTKPIARG